MVSKYTKALGTATLISCIAVFPHAVLGAEAADLEAAASVATDTKFMIELAAKCGTPISIHANLRLERFAVALDLSSKGLGPQKLSRADFENVMT